MKWLASQGYVLMAMTAFFWSGNAVIGRGVHEIVPPIGLAFWRWLATIPLLLLIAWPHLRREWPVIAGNWRILLVLSVLSITVYNTVIYFGLNHTTAINMLLINAGRPVIIVFLSYLILDHRITALQGLGLLIGLVGTAVIVLRGDLDVLTGLDLNLGDLLIVVATVAWALYTVLLPKRPRMHGASFLTICVLMGTAILLPFYLYEAFFVEAMPLVAESVWSVAYLALFASVAAFLSYNKVVELLGPNRAAVTSYLVPVFGVALAIVALGEAFRLFHAVGVALLLVGSYLATRPKPA